MTLAAGTSSNCNNLATNNSCSLRFNVDASQALATGNKVIVAVESFRGPDKKQTELVIGTNIFNVQRSGPDNASKGGGGGSTSLGFVLLSILAFFTRRFK